MGLEELVDEVGKIKEIRSQLKGEVNKEKPNRDRIRTLLLEIEAPYEKIHKRISNIDEERGKLIQQAQSIINYYSSTSPDADVRIVLNTFITDSDSLCKRLEQDLM